MTADQFIVGVMCAGAGLWIAGHSLVTRLRARRGVDLAPYRYPGGDR